MKSIIRFFINLFFGKPAATASITRDYTPIDPLADPETKRAPQEEQEAESAAPMQKWEFRKPARGTWNRTHRGHFRGEITPRLITE